VRVTQLFVAPRASRPPEPAPPATPSASAALVAPVDPGRPGDSAARVDLGRVEIQFADDVSGQLPAVLSARSGALALLDREDPTIARYLARPPGWEAVSGVTDVSRSLRVLMEPPARWALWRRIAARSGLALDHYQAAAVFDPDYRRCIQQRVRDYEAAHPGPAGAEVTSVRLAFVSDLPCGLEVLEVRHGAQSRREH
jgi:hypothetical protein